MVNILPFLIAYLIGSIPTGYIFGWLLKGVDIRKEGSGNVGATNVFRVVGKIPGIIVLLVDILKGLVIITLFANLFKAQVGLSQNLFKIILGLAVIAGHNWTIFLKFKGGKGVATSAGVLIGLEPIVVALCFLIWVIVFVITHYVSLSSVIAALFLPIFTLLFYRSSTELLIFSLIICVIGIYKHRSNIKRLLNGTESKISFKKSA